MDDRERQQIRELLEADHSRRAVAELVGRGLGTVARVGVAAQRDDDEPGDEIPQRRLRSAVRCPTCGGQVHVLPCLLCTARGR